MSALPDLSTTDAYDYTLPPELVAHAPVSPRPASRMLVVEGEERRDAHTRDVVSELREGDLLVVNDAKVSPVRLAARRATGGAVEVFVLGLGDEGRWEDPGAPWVAFTRSSKKLQPGEALALEGRAPHERVQLRVDAIRDDGTRVLTPTRALDVWEVLNERGSLPLPPYIVKRRRELGEAEQAAADRERYQTVFAKARGAVAAPTAGLHFDDALLRAIEAKGVRRAPVTLFVGAGTFKPVSAGRLDEHEMHREHFVLPDATAEAVRETHARGGRVVAVGTTVVRTLESAWSAGELRAGAASTRLFIRPGYAFRVVDALLTNFHLPKSTLLALVCAFGGYREVMDAYAHALREGYRFYSYGDAMFLRRKAPLEREVRR